VDAPELVVDRHHGRLERPESSDLLDDAPAHLDPGCALVEGQGIKGPELERVISHGARLPPRLGRGERPGLLVR
jgi:hypothetical protein